MCAIALTAKVRHLIHIEHYPIEDCIEESISYTQVRYKDTLYYTMLGLL